MIASRWASNNFRLGTAPAQSWRTRRVNRSHIARQSLKPSPLRWRGCLKATPDWFALAWGTSVQVDAQSVAANLFASSIVPYSAFLYFLHRSRLAPPLALFGCSARTCWRHQCCGCKALQHLH